MGPFLTDEGESSPDLSQPEGGRTAPASIYTNDYGARTSTSGWTVTGIRKTTNFYWTIMVPPSSQPKLLYHVGHGDDVENQPTTHQRARFHLPSFLQNYCQGSVARLRPATMTIFTSSHSFVPTTHRLSTTRTKWSRDQRLDFRYGHGSALYKKVVR